MRLLRPLLRLTRLDHQRNPDISNRLKVNNIVEDTKLCHKKWLDHLEQMNRSHLLRLTFHYQPWGWWDVGRQEMKMERPRTPYALKERVLRNKL
jgi:hypothetical protein